MTEAELKELERLNSDVIRRLDTKIPCAQHREHGFGYIDLDSARKLALANARLLSTIREQAKELSAAESRGMERAAKLCEGEIMDLRYEDGSPEDAEYDRGCRACASVIRRDITIRTAAQETTNDAK